MDESTLMERLDASGCEAFLLAPTGEYSHNIVVGHFDRYPGASGLIDATEVANGTIIYRYGAGLADRQLNLSGLDEINVLDSVGVGLMADNDLAIRRKADAREHPIYINLRQTNHINIVILA